jgi:hypothetical protein
VDGPDSEETLRTRIQRTDDTDETPSVSFVSGLPAGPEVAEALPGGVTEARRSLLAADVVAMPLSEFARARLVVTVQSAVLDEVIVFASDNAIVDPGEQRVVYRAAELRELLGLSAKELRAVHRVKGTFRGTILPS